MAMLPYHVITWKSSVRSCPFRESVMISLCPSGNRYEIYEPGRSSSSQNASAAATARA